MPSAWILESIAILAGSFVAGFIVHFMLTPFENKQQRKQMTEEVLGTVINFIIYIWVGKILWDLPTLFDDPLAVLAYPSGSASFYLATLFTAVHLGFRVYKGSLDIWPHLKGLLQVFFVASFTFEFIGAISENSGQNLAVLSCLFGLVIVMAIIHNRMSKAVEVSLLVSIWGVGYTLLSVFLPYVTVFDYLLAWWYYASFAVLGVIVFIMYYRRKVSS